MGSVMSAATLQRPRSASGPALFTFGFRLLISALLVASDTLPIYKAVTAWLAKQIRVRPITVPGCHGFYYYRPQDLANALRPILKGFL
jgi:hypothetical protein